VARTDRGNVHGAEQIVFLCTHSRPVPATLVVLERVFYMPFYILRVMNLPRVHSSSLQRGFTLIELLIGIAVFSVVAWSAYSGFAAIFEALTVLRARGAAANLANEQFEILRNLPYANVGIKNGVPAGVFPREQVIVRDGIRFTVTTTIRNIDLPQDGTLGGSPNDTVPIDAKLAEVEISCEQCALGEPVRFSSQVSPKGVESMGNNGALFVFVVDSAGQPVVDADVLVRRVGSSTVVQDTTDSFGMLSILGLTPGTAAYRATTTLDGYSTERTYQQGGTGNPNPIMLDATIAAGQVTNLTFVIDKLSQIDLRSVNDLCTPVSNFDFTFNGEKLIGTNVRKYSQNLSTGSSAELYLDDMEWDTYSALSNDTSHMLIGTNPPQPLAVAPDISASLDLVLAARSYPALVVTVLDGSGEPVADADVSLFVSSATTTKQTSRGATAQTNWSGGSGQDLVGSLTQYKTSDGQVNTTSSPGNLRLSSTSGTYALSGWLESSTFDLGTTTDFGALNWQPATQAANLGANPVRFQVATNDTLSATTTWSYKGPDGTSGSYYTVSGTPFHADHDSERYVRYKVFLSRSTANATPIVSDVSFSYTTDCAPPGQTYFSGTGSGSARVTVSKEGYVTSRQNVTLTTGWNSLVMTLGE
jgi:prepilin-type N-terminal cleavage/methylation domain-containing protein